MVQPPGAADGTPAKSCAGQFQVGGAASRSVAPRTAGSLPTASQSGPDWQLLIAGTIIGEIARNLNFALFFRFAFLFVLYLFRALLRNEWAAAVLFVVFFTVLLNAENLAACQSASASWVLLIRGLILNSMSVFLLIRLGLLAGVAGAVVQFCLQYFR